MGSQYSRRKEAFDSKVEMSREKRIKKQQLAALTVHDTVMTVFFLVFSAQVEVGCYPPALQNSSGSISVAVTKIRV